MTSTEATAALMREVFPQHPKYRRSGYLEWQYNQSPSGQVIEANRDEESNRRGHYAVVPQRWVIDGTPCVVGLSLNTAVSSRIRGQGVFGTLGRQVVAAAQGRGYTAVVGVANAESSHGMVKHLGFDLVGPLPVVVIPPTAPRRARSYEVGTVNDMCDRLQESEWSVPFQSGAQRVWDVDEFSWRMSNPANDYQILLDDDVAAVVHQTLFRGIRVAVITKVFLRESRGDVDVSPLASAACGVLRSALALYAGNNPQLATGGIPVPVKLRPSPLNLVVKCLVDEINPESVVPRIFEFLDFDAY